MTEAAKSPVYIFVCLILQDFFRRLTCLSSSTRRRQSSKSKRSFLRAQIWSSLDLEVKAWQTESTLAPAIEERLLVEEAFEILASRGG